MAKLTVFALIDCNNFFVSCEKVFRPDLEGRPVIVMSNNDGNAVARSNEAKALGIKMGQPFFEVKDMFLAQKGVAFSANFQLYGDMSRRITDVIRQFSPDIEVYSIDESFVDLSKLAVKDYSKLAAEIRQKILAWTGVPTSVGIGPSKTLAKAASEYAKKHPETSGSFNAVTDVKSVLNWLPVGDVWGIGFRSAPRLEKLGIKTAQDFANMSPEWVQKQMSVTGLRTWKELNGESCVPLSGSVYDSDHEQKSMSTSRLFGKKINDQYELELAIADHAARLSAKLRRRHQIAWSMVIYAEGNRKPYQTFSHKLKLPYPTSDTAKIISAAISGLNQIYDREQTYRRVGLILDQLTSENSEQITLIDRPKDETIAKRKTINKSVDYLNERFGPKAVIFGAQGVSDNHDYKSKQKQRSPAYTTNWQEIPIVKAK